MTQLHSIHHGLGIVRPTNDIDIVLHIETSRGVAAEAVTALRSLGYDLRSAVDPRDNTAHRFYRGTSKIDLVTDRHAEEPEEMVDVLVSDHHAPQVTERLAGRDMVRIDGGTQLCGAPSTRGWKSLPEPSPLSRCPVRSARSS